MPGSWTIKFSEGASYAHASATMPGDTKYRKAGSVTQPKATAWKGLDATLCLAPSHAHLQVTWDVHLPLQQPPPSNFILCREA